MNTDAAANTATDELRQRVWNRSSIPNGTNPTTLNTIWSNAVLVRTAATPSPAVAWHRSCTTSHGSHYGATDPPTQDALGLAGSANMVNATTPLAWVEVTAACITAPGVT